MKHRASRKFWNYYRQLPASVQRVANKNYQLLKSNPGHPSLHFKPVGRYWSVRVGANYRALGLGTGPDVVWFWIGTHAEYNDIIKH